MPGFESPIDPIQQIFNTNASNERTYSTTLQLER